MKSVCGHSGRTGTDASCFSGGVRVPSGSPGAPGERSGSRRFSSAPFISADGGHTWSDRGEHFSGQRSSTQVSFGPDSDSCSPAVHFYRLLFTFNRGKESFESLLEPRSVVHQPVANLRHRQWNVQRELLTRNSPFLGWLYVLLPVNSSCGNQWRNAGPLGNFQTLR